MPVAPSGRFRRRNDGAFPGTSVATPTKGDTAYARTEDRLSAQDAGFQLHWMRPVHPSELAALGANLAARRQR